MHLNQDWYKKNEELQKEIKKELAKVKQGKGKKNQDQLELILNELVNIQINKHVALSYPRIIIDSWDFSDSLGLKLLKLAEEYKKID